MGFGPALWGFMGVYGVLSCCEVPGRVTGAGLGALRWLYRGPFLPCCLTGSFSPSLSPLDSMPC